MAGETQTTIVGNLTADPELRYTQSGVPVASLTIASTPRIFDRQGGGWKDGDPLFLRCTVWREFAENIAATLHKGTRVVAQGNLRQRNYETKEGERRTAFELDISAIGPDLRYATAMITRKTSNTAASGTHNVSPQSNYVTPDDSWSAASVNLGDTPF